MSSEVPQPVNLGQAELLVELGELARLAARQPDLVLRAGETGCNWSFNWRDRVIEVPPDQLAVRPGDFCRGLVLHEAAHAAITRLQDIVPEDQRRSLHALLNALEDCRIETWMRGRFPGAVGWVRTYNDLLFGEMRSQPWPVSRCAQFLRGILETWWFGGITAGARPEVAGALHGIGPALERVVASQPSAIAVSIGEMTGATAPWSPEAEVQAAQRSMWEVTRTEIVPVWEELAGKDADEGLAGLSADELERLTRFLRAFCHWIADRGGEARDCGKGETAPGNRGRIQLRPGGLRVQLPHSMRARLAAALAPDGGDAYLAAYHKIHPLVDRLAAELIRIFQEEGKSRWKKRQAEGRRLDLRTAMRFEVDRGCYGELWDARIAPRQFDPCVALLLDRSSSMEGAEMKSAFEGLVLLTEVCHRAGIPVAVHSFAGDHRCDLPFGGELDAVARRRLGALLGHCRGGTNMADGIAAAGADLESRPYRHRVLIVLGDGQPQDESAARVRIAALRKAGIACLGLGLGPETAPLAGFFDHALVEVPVEHVAENLAALLRRAVVGAS